MRILFLLAIINIGCGELSPTLNFMTDKHFNFTWSSGQCMSFDCYDRSMQCWTCSLKQRYLTVRTVAPRRAHLLLSFQDLRIAPDMKNFNSYIFYGQNYEVHLYPRQSSHTYEPISYMVSAWSGDYLVNQHITRLTINLNDYDF